LGVNYEQVLKETDKSFEIGTQQGPRLTALRVLKDAISDCIHGQSLFPARKAEDVYLRRKAGYPPHRCGCNWNFSSVEIRALDHRNGRSWSPDTPMTDRSEWIGCPFRSPSADWAIAYATEGLQRLTDFWQHLHPLWIPGFRWSCSSPVPCSWSYRLNVLERKGLEGTVLGTLVMPYASGFPNLMFAFSLGPPGGQWVDHRRELPRQQRHQPHIAHRPAGPDLVLDHFPVPIDRGPPAGRSPNFIASTPCR
jgi:hypothetical protein